MKPQADAPPSWSRATIGPATRNAAKAKFQTACAPRLRRYQRRPATARMPSPSSRQKFFLPMPVIGWVFRNASDVALAAKVAASMAKETAGPTVATSTPETAGPTSHTVLLVSPISAFAC